MASDMTEEQLKKNILSLLISSSQVATINSIQRDFRDLIGYPIPFHKFNCNSVEHFLKSITDVCTVNGSGSYAKVLPRITENSAHINEMVTLQKKNPPKRRSHARGPSFQARRPPFQRTYNKTYTQNYAFSPHASSSNSSMASYNNGEKCNNNYPSCNVNNYSAPVPKPPQYGATAAETVSIPDKNLKNTNVSYNSTLNNNSLNKSCESGVSNQKLDVTPKEDIASRGLGSTLVKKKLERLIMNQMEAGNVSQSATIAKSSSSQSRESLELVQNWINSNNNVIPDNAPKDLSNYLSQSHDDVNACTATLSRLDVTDTKDTTLEDTSNVPKKVQSNLKILINQFEDGIWVHDLLDQYRQMFRRELAWMEYGYTSLIDMCIACSHIFHYVRPERDDFKLYDRNKPLPPNVEKKFTIASYDTGEKTFNYEPIPELDFSDFKGHIPDDVFEYGREISRQFLPEGTKPENVLDVVVVEIYDPSKFWFYLGLNDNTAPLDVLMDNLKLFYEDPENARRYSVPLGAIKEGLYCAHMIYGEYHRARVVRVYPDDPDHIRLLYVDYGTVGKCTRKGLCFLQKDFAEMPIQAIRCRLANIKPVLKGHPWPRATSDRFRELVNRRNTKIKVSYIDWNEEYVCVFLADVTDPEVVYINELLVNERLAVWDDEKQIEPFVLSNFTCRVKYLHLFPTFVELEFGMAPNAAEMYTLEEMLVPLHFCIPQYFERNSQVPADSDSDIEEFESTFIDTVKQHRKITPWYKIDFRKVSRPPPLNFDVFGEMKKEIMTFYKTLNGLGELNYCGSSEEYFTGHDHHNMSGSRVKSPAADVRPESEPNGHLIPLVSETQKLSEDIIRELEQFKFDDRLSDNTENKSCNSDEPKPLVDGDYSNYSCAGRNNYKKYAIMDDSISELELSTILEQSESEDFTSCPSPFSTLKIDSQPTVSIFDNPDDFVNSSDSASPVTPQEFFKSLDRFCTKSAGLGSDGQESSSNSITSTSNPFKTETPPLPTGGDPFDLFLKRCTKNFVSASVCDRNSEAGSIKDIPDSTSELSFVKDEFSSVMCDKYSNFKSSDLPFRRALDNTKTSTRSVQSVSLTNPFWDGLEDQENHDLDSECANVAKKTEASLSKTSEQLNTLKSDSTSDCASSDSGSYKVVVRQEKAPPPPAPNDKETVTSSGDKKSPSETQQTYRNLPGGQESRGQMSVHAEVFVPMGMGVAYHPSYGSWSLPQYPQWSNAGYPAAYSAYPSVPPPPPQESAVRPPPGFSSVPAYAPKTYPPPGHFNVYPPEMVPRMQPAMYPPHYQAAPIFYNRPNPTSGKDFYEAHNKQAGQKR